MLERLEIHHYALIEDSTIEFPGGFSVITGETGAGKSILLGALTLLLGEKTEVQSIRSGCDSATVSASFHIAQPMGVQLASFLAKEELELEETPWWQEEPSRAMDVLHNHQGRLQHGQTCPHYRELLDISTTRPSSFCPPPISFQFSIPSVLAGRKNRLQRAHMTSTRA